MVKPFIYFEANDVCHHLEKALSKRLREFGKGFWIAKVQPWIHPYNEVKNCIALTLDGSVYYKFQVMVIRSPKYNDRFFCRFRVAQTPKGNSFAMDVKKNQRLSFPVLLDKIAAASVG